MHQEVLSWIRVQNTDPFRPPSPRSARLAAVGSNQSASRKPGGRYPASTPRAWKSGDYPLGSGLRGFQLPHERDDVLTEELDLFLEMQEAEQDQVRPGPLQADGALGDLLRYRSGWTGTPSLYCTRSWIVNFAQLPSRIVNAATFWMDVIVPACTTPAPWRYLHPAGKAGRAWRMASGAMVDSPRNGSSTTRMNAITSPIAAMWRVIRATLAASS